MLCVVRLFFDRQGEEEEAEAGGEDDLQDCAAAEHTGDPGEQQQLLAAELDQLPVPVCDLVDSVHELNFGGASAEMQPRGHGLGGLSECYSQ